MLGQVLINGLAMGFCYGLVALSMVMIYKTTQVLNFAQGEMAMLSTFFAYTLLSSFHLPFLLAFFLTIGFAFLLGVTLEFTFLRPAKTPTVLGLIIITLGFEMILYGTASWIWGAETKAFPLPVSDTSIYTFGGVIVSELNIVTFSVCLFIVTLLALFFRFSVLGIAMRATSQNETAARLMGIRTRWIYSFTWGLSSIIGALAGMLLVPLIKLDPNMMLDPLLKGFTAAVLGGMTSMLGAVFGGCFLGIVENLGAAYISTEFKSIIAFLLIILVLCVKPSGLFAPHYVRRV